MMLAVSISMQAVTNQEYFLQGNQAYNAGDFEQAINAYNAIKQPNSAVWCNKGLAYHALSQDQEALYCWYQALEQEPGNIAYHINRCIAEQEVANPDRAHGLLTRAWSFMLRPLVYGMPLAIIQWLFIILLVLLVILGCRSSPVRIWGSIVIGIGIFLIGTLLAMRYYCTHAPYAIIAAQAPLFIGPDTSYYQNGQTTCPALVTIIETKPGWVYIKQGQNRNWVATSSIKLLHI